MAKRLAVTSPYPNLRGHYTERGSSGGRPAFAKDQDSATWIFYAAEFGCGPSWYFGSSLPSKGSLTSFCRSRGDAAAPEHAEWPQEDIAKVEVISSADCVLLGGSAATSSKTAPELSAQALPACQAACAACSDLQSLHTDLRCPSCNPGDASQERLALGLLKGKVSDPARKRISEALASGDLETRSKLCNIAASQSEDGTPFIILEPPPQVELSSKATTLLVEACSISGMPLRYQWHKDGVPIPRAERPRLVLCWTSPKDEGSYSCTVSASCASVSSRSCEASLSSTEAAKRSRYEAPLQQAAEAERLGKFEDAVTFLTQAINAAEDTEAVRNKALRRRAELLLRLEHWQEAFCDSDELVRDSPGLVHAHAVRGAAAAKLGKLAEAVSSWETAEILGGVPNAAVEAEACRRRLQEFFEKQQAQRGSSGFPTGSQSSAGEGAEDPEESWKRSGWQGRYTGGGVGGAKDGQGKETRNTSQSAELQQHLEVLGLGAHNTGRLPSQDVVRSAYRQKALQVHPDKPGGSKTAFQKLQKAYETVLAMAPY